MKKNKLKNYLKLGILLFGISISFVYCDEDDFYSLDTVSIQLEENPIKFSIKKFSDLENDDKFNDAIERIIKPVEDNETKHSNTYNRTIMEDEYGFTIDSSTVKQIDINDFTSYTMLIHRDEHSSDFFENLVVQIDSLNEISAYIVKYIPTSEYSYNDIHNSYSFEGDVEITPIVYNATESTANRMVYSCSDFYQLKCNGGNNGNCSGAYHDPGPQCYEEYNPCIGLVQTGQTCGYSDDGSGGGGGDPTDTDGDGTADDCTTCGANGSNTNTNEGETEEDTVITATIPSIDDTQDCEKLKNLMKKPINNQAPKKVKELLNQLKDSVSLVNYELGYFLNPIDATEQEFNSHHFEGNENADEILLNLGTNAVSVIMHIHYNNEAENKIQLSVPSLTDLLQIYQSISIGNIFSPNTFTFFVVTEHGTKYALQIDDSATFLNSGLATKYLINWRFGNIQQNAENIFEADYGINPNKTNAHNELQFAKYLKEQNLGINLFKANDDFTELTKLDYNNGTLTEIPCN